MELGRRVLTLYQCNTLIFYAVSAPTWPLRGSYSPINHLNLGHRKSQTCTTKNHPHNFINRAREDEAKVVIKVSFSGEKKSRTKVMQAAVGVPGVESIAFGASHRVEKEEEEKMTEPGVQPMVWPTVQAGVPQYYYTVVPDNRSEPCSIM
ncbi:hypothetical protein CK203_084919 [Vitis vinifera]|uniref:Uncharacterized protein n=1 Tax=Vitis vinifera TaxID=29760 RepID=A0A438CXC7_VITVI|nr:hypothetical protein CK203_084919 [Vitis vinifera]